MQLHSYMLRTAFPSRMSTPIVKCGRSASLHPLKLKSYHRVSSSLYTKTRNRQQFVDRYDNKQKVTTVTTTTYTVPLLGLKLNFERTTETHQHDYVPTADQVQLFLKRSFMTTGVGMAGGLITAQILRWTMSSFVFSHPVFVVLSGAALAIASTCRLRRIPAYYDPVDPTFIYSSNSRWLLFGLVSMGGGVALAPALCHVTAINPWIFPAATVLSLITMVVNGLYALRQPHDSLLKFPTMSKGILIGLASMGLVSTGSYFVLGSNPLIDVWTMPHIATGVGLVVFTGLAARDIQRCIHLYRSQEDMDPLRAGLTIYESFFISQINFPILNKNVVPSSMIHQ